MSPSAQPQTLDPERGRPITVVKSPTVSYDGKTIRAARIRAGLTIEELAMAVGAGTRTASRWQRHGIKDDSHWLATVADVLNLTTNPRAAAAQGLADDIAAADGGGIPSDLEELTDGALFSLSTHIAAEIQRRYWAARIADKHAADTTWPGTQLPHPDHLIEDEATPRRAGNGE